MREKIYKILNRIYGVSLTVSFFAAFLPLFPFIAAIFIGGGDGGAGEAISLFLKNYYYPWVIALAAVSVVIGLVAMYVGKLEGLSVKKINADKKAEDSPEEKAEEKDENK